MKTHLKKFKKAVSEKLERNTKFLRRKCNLCHEVFRAPTKFYRFCQNCRQESELFRFYDVFPVKA